MLIGSIVWQLKIPRVVKCVDWVYLLGELIGCFDRVC